MFYNCKGQIVYGGNYLDDINETLVKIAMYYYEDGMTQTEIAKLLGISRPTVASRLKEAKEKEIVKITIKKKFMKEIELSKKQDYISTKYNLQNVLISNTYDSDLVTKASLGDLCATFIEKKLPEINSLGIGWGTTVKAYVDSANYLNYSNISIVPLIGGVSTQENSLHSNYLAFTLAHKYSAHSSSFYAPAIAENTEIKNTLYNSEFVQDILKKGRNVDLAIVGVGNPLESKTYRNMGYISIEEEKELIKKNAVGDILTTFYNNDGKSVKTSLSDRMIGHSVNDIQNMKEVVVLASGKSKANSIKALLKLNIISHLIIDESIAKEL